MKTFWTGHLNIGKHITIYGANAMQWAVNIKTKRWGWVCFTLPAIARFRKYHGGPGWFYDWYFYCSPNATPWAATFYRGRNKSQQKQAAERRKVFGHNFNVYDDSVYRALRQFNNK